MCAAQSAARGPLADPCWLCGCVKCSSKRGKRRRRCDRGVGRHLRRMSVRRERRAQRRRRGGIQRMSARALCRAMPVIENGNEVRRCTPNKQSSSRSVPPETVESRRRAHRCEQRTRGRRASFAAWSVEPSIQSRWIQTMLSGAGAQSGHAGRLAGRLASILSRHPEIYDALGGVTAWVMNRRSIRSRCRHASRSCEPRRAPC